MLSNEGYGIFGEGGPITLTDVKNVGNALGPLGGPAFP
jgi:hypothetical protein